MSQEYHFKKQTRMQKEQYLKAAGVQDYSNGTFVLVNGQEEAEDESTKELS